MIEFTGTEAIIFKGKYLVLSDLHLGIEKEYLLNGINLPPQTENLFKKIKSLKEKYNIKKLIVVGDFKHNVPKISYLELKEVPIFIENLSKIFDKVYIIKGNHDGNIENLKPNVDNVKIVKELKISNVTFTHGHRKSKFKGKLYIIGHHHFVFNITSSIGESFYEKVFVYAKTEKYNVFILPAFSNLARSWEVGTFHGPITKNIKEYEILTLDGIVIKNISLRS